VEAQLKERARQEAERGRKFGGRPPELPDPEKAQPEPQAQRNFTDPDSRIMKDGATKEFVQAYNAQAVVDSPAQVIVAAVTQEANDKQQLVPMLEQVKIVLGSQPQQATADAGYFSKANVTDSRLEGIDLLVAPDRPKHGERRPVVTRPPAGSPPGLSPTPSAAQAMRNKLRTPQGQAVYKMRKAVVEPVFGQIKEQRGFRRFLLRGLRRVEAEWLLICATHNLLKLFRSGWSPQMA
jgi:DDE family transposase